MLDFKSQIVALWMRLNFATLKGRWKMPNFSCVWMLSSFQVQAWAEHSSHLYREIESFFHSEPTELTRPNLNWCTTSIKLSRTDKILREWVENSKQKKTRPILIFCVCVFYSFHLFEFTELNILFFPCLILHSDAIYILNVETWIFPTHSEAYTR